MKTPKPIEEIFWVDRNTDGDQFGGRVVALADGGFVICWTDAGDHGDGTGSWVRGQVYDSGGKPSGDELLIGGANELDHFSPALAATTDGGFVVSWTVGVDGKPDYPSWIEAQAFDARGERIGEDVAVTDRIGATGSTITALGDGRFLVGWGYPGGDHGDVSARIFSIKGAALGDALHLTDLSDGLQTALSSAMLESGGFVAVWASDSGKDQDDDGFGIEGALFGSKGEPLGETFQINVSAKFDQAAPHVVATDKGFVVVWADQGIEDEGAIHARFFDEKGNALGEQIDVASRVHDSDLAPMIAVNATGEVLIACASSGVIYAQLYAADGTALSEVYQVAEPDGGDRGDAGVAVLASGEFVLTWTEHDPKSGDGSGSTVVAQLFTFAEEANGQDDYVKIAEDDTLQVHWKQLLENDGLSPMGAVAIDHVDGVTHGLVTIDSEGFITFTPDADFNGAASFVYHLTGDGGFTDTATVYVEVAPVDDAPVAVDDVFRTPAGSELAGTVAANDHDIDSITLGFALVDPVAGLAMAAHGGYVSDALDPAYRALGEGQTLDVVALYTVTDDDGASAIGKLVITVTGINDAPSFDPVTVTPLPENSSGGTQVAVVIATDVDGDTVSYSLAYDADGRFVIDAATGVIRVTDGAILDYEANRFFTLKIDASDGHGGMAQQVVTVQLVDIAETLTGDGGANRIHPIGGGDWRLEGLDGNDHLFDGPGHVTLVGGNGDDIYVVTNSLTELVELADAGRDTVVTRLASYQLGDNIEILRASAAADFAGTGNALANLVVGNAGNDLLSGNAGNDILIGGAGGDVLLGGADADRFKFFTVAESSPATAVDRIVDFSHAELDRIDLGRIDAIAGVANSRFTFIGDAAFSGHAGELRFEQAGGMTLVMGDVNGDGVADLLVRLDGVHPLVATDFVL